MTNILSSLTTMLMSSLDVGMKMLENNQDMEREMKR